MNINIIDDDVWRDILSFAEVEAKTNKDIPPSKSKAVPCFGWDDRDVHAQSDRCDSTSTHSMHAHQSVLL